MRRIAALCFAALALTATAWSPSDGVPRAEWPAGLPNALLAAGPDSRLRDKLDLFGQFVGNWNVDVINHLPDGRTQTVKGEWHFGWILGGAAIQDVWMAPTRAQRAAKEPLIGYGTTLRFYDPKIDAWRIVWASASYRNVILFTAQLLDG